MNFEEFFYYKDFIYAVIPNDNRVFRCSKDNLRIWTIYRKAVPVGARWVSSWLWEDLYHYFYEWFDSFNF